MIKQQIEGSNDVKLIFTEEEDNREMTYDRLNDYMCHLGEDFCDDRGGEHVDAGLLAKFLYEHNDNKDVPERKQAIAEAAADGADAQGLLYAYEEDGIEDGTELFYTHLAEFINLYPELRKQINHILIEAFEE